MRALRLVALATVTLTADCRTPVPLYDDLGSFTHRISSRVPEAQRYFDQGLRLTYAFNHAEAVRAFDEAARRDDRCAICWWGVALAWGPNINIPMDSAGEAAAWAAIQEARRRAAHASEPERAYIEALAARHGVPAGADRARRDSTYATAMRSVRDRFAGDPDAAVLYADAMMNLRPWNYWQPDGSPYPGTEDILATLEGAVGSDSTHPGACHFYIHAVEKVQPERAVACAERLARLMPGAGHLVHMPAHIYFRVGRYGDAVAANEHASHADSVYLEGQRPGGGLYPLFYTPHNHHFRSAAAAMEGRFAAALDAARQTARLTPIDNVRAVPPAELYVPVPLYVLARFGRWDDILRETAPPAELRFTTGIWRYARGLAFAATGRADSARREAAALDSIVAATPAEAIIGLNSGRTLLEIASHALAGEIAARARLFGDAVRHLDAAIRLEDGLTYDEPPPWYFPVRHALGAVWLAADRPRDAEAVYREDLRRYPENGWSLIGLRNALRAQRQWAAADSADARFRQAWARADAPITASRL